MELYQHRQAKNSLKCNKEKMKQKRQIISPTLHYVECTFSNLGQTTLCCVCWICLMKIIHFKCQAIFQPQGKFTLQSCGDINYITLTSLNSLHTAQQPQLSSWPETHYLSNGAAITDGSGCWQALHILKSLHSPGPPRPLKLNMYCLTWFTTRVRTNSSGQEIAFKFKCAFLAVELITLCYSNCVTHTIHSRWHSYTQTDPGDRIVNLKQTLPSSTYNNQPCLLQNKAVYC